MEAIGRPHGIVVDFGGSRLGRALAPASVRVLTSQRMIVSVIDDMGRPVIAPVPPKRIVSLVPSDTYSLWKMGCGERVVGRTNYCEEPHGHVDAVPTVGGSKDVDVEKVLSLAPDLVVANQEENTRNALEAIANRGIKVYISFPRRLADSFAHLAKLATLLCVQKEPEVREIIKNGYALMSHEPTEIKGTVFVPIWNEPLMTFSEDTYASDLLRHVGLVNCFADRERKYPLAADLGRRSPLGADQVRLMDTRYPRIVTDEIVERTPGVILLPDEPFEFTSHHVEEFRKLFRNDKAMPTISLCDGKDLFWHGVRSIEALPRLKVLVESCLAQKLN